jgi:hypothetical protein
MPEGFKKDWRAFRAERASMTIADIDVEIGKIHVDQQANPRKRRTRK